MSWQKFLLVPRLMWHGLRGPGDAAKAWENYWSSIQRTGADGDVLWDAGSEAELSRSLGQVLSHMERTLPVIDIGCGNGRHSRALAAHFASVVGLDLSSTAVEKARQESKGLTNVSYEVLDASAPSAGQVLAQRFGECNAYVRGVFHVLSPQHRRRMVENLRTLLGLRGVLFLLETAHHGSPLDYLESLGATATSIPEPLKLCIQSGVRAPVSFNERVFREYFPATGWETLECGSTVIHGVPMSRRGELEQIPGFYALVRPRPG